MTTLALPEKRAAFKNRWWIVAASLAGNVVGPGPVVIFITNVFLLPVTTEFHWTRGMFSASLLASAIIGPIAQPVFGWLLDRFGIRRVALPAAVLYSLALCSFALLSANAYWAIFLMVGCAAGFGACLGPISYSKAITAWFDRERGLALGIATCGVGLGTVLMPELAAHAIAVFGWRIAYVVVGLTTLVISFAVIALFVREPPGFLESTRFARGHAAEAPQALGLAPGQVIMGTRQFWLLAAIFLLEGLACNGILSGNFVPLLRDRGYSVTEAVALLGTTGLAAMAARIVVGLGLDFLHGPIFSTLFMLLPPIGVGLLLTHDTGATPLLAAICIGLAIGAEMDILGFFVSRYFGPRAFATVYGLLFALFVFGIGVGPAFMGFSYDNYHSYDPVLRVFLALLVVAALLFLPLGKYRFPKAGKQDLSSFLGVGAAPH